MPECQNLWQRHHEFVGFETLINNFRDISTWISF